MKNLLTLLLFSGAVIASAQSPDIGTLPKGVADAFKAEFPMVNMYQPDWEIADGEYRAEFENHADLKDNVIAFKKDGALLFTEVEMPVENLPACYAKEIEINYPGHRIKKATLMTLANNETCYGVELADQSLLFDSSCKIMQEQISQNR